MKVKHVIIKLLLLGSIVSRSQPSNWLWAKSLNASNEFQFVDMSTSKIGDVVVTGSFFSVQPVVLGSYTFVADGLIDYFVAKYDAQGNLLWALKNGGSAQEWIEDLCVDDSGNIYITGGSMSPTIAFGGTTYTNTSGSDKFVVKYNASGTFQWVKINDGWTSYVATDSFGNLLLAGQHNAPLVIGTNTFVNHSGGSDIYLAKYNSSGNLIWALSDGSAADDALNSIHIDANDNIILTGYFVGDSTVFGNSTLVGIDTASKGDIFLVKYDSFGSFVWGKNIGGGAEVQQALSTSSDVTGNIYCTGLFTSPSLSFGTTTLVNSSSSQNNADMFIAKFNALGNLIWAKNETGVGDEVGGYIAVDAIGNVYVAGFFFGPSMSMGNAMYMNTDTVGTTRDIILMRYDAFGNLLWADQINGNKEDRVSALSIDGNGNVYMSGHFLSDAISFGSNSLLNNNSTEPRYDHFLAKLKTDKTNRIEKYARSNVEFFPNPVSEHLNFVIPNDHQANLSITITNLIGQTLFFNPDFEIDNTKRIQSIDLSFLSSGIYVMTIRNDEYQGHLKFVKEK